MKALIALEDGTIFTGQSFTGPGEAVGEIVFNTSHERLSGGPYRPLLYRPDRHHDLPADRQLRRQPGRHGIGGRPSQAFLVKEYQRHPRRISAPRGTLAEFLQQYGVLGVEGFDTRALVRHIRTGGAMKGIVSTRISTPPPWSQRAREWTGLVGQDMVKSVTCAEPYGWAEQRPGARLGFHHRPAGCRPVLKVVAFDFGIKYNQLRILHRDGLPGPGRAGHHRRRHRPGHEAGRHLPLQRSGRSGRGGRAWSRTSGHCSAKCRSSASASATRCSAWPTAASTYKLKFGHRGGNQPVKDLTTGQVEITSQNHGFCVDHEQPRPDEVELTHINLNDNSVEGHAPQKISGLLGAVPSRTCPRPA